MGGGVSDAKGGPALVAGVFGERIDGRIQSHAVLGIRPRLGAGKIHAVPNLRNEVGLGGSNRLSNGRSWPCLEFCHAFSNSFHVSGALCPGRVGKRRELGIGPRPYIGFNGIYTRGSYTHQHFPGSRRWLRDLNQLEIHKNAYSNLSPKCGIKGQKRPACWFAKLIPAERPVLQMQKPESPSSSPLLLLLFEKTAAAAGSIYHRPGPAGAVIAESLSKSN